MKKNHKIILASVITVIIIFSGFTLYEIETEPAYPSLRVIPANELYNAALVPSLPPPNNITSSNCSYYVNTTSTINASYGGSNVSFLFYQDFEPFVSFTKDSTYNGLTYAIVKTGQNLSFHVTGFSFSIKNFIVAYNNSVISNADKITPEASCIQDGGTLLCFSALSVMPFSFTIGNYTAINRYYYVNYSFEFTPIVEIGFIHFALKPIYVKNYYLAPWGFKTPQKPWWEK